VSHTASLIGNKGKFGGKYPNGTLSGALGNLQKRKSDIALTAFFMKVIIWFFVASSKLLLVWRNENGNFFAHYDLMRCICYSLVV
jgi:hypothetical protein